MTSFSFHKLKGGFVRVVLPRTDVVVWVGSCLELRSLPLGYKETLRFLVQLKSWMDGCIGFGVVDGLEEECVVGGSVGSGIPFIVFDQTIKLSSL